MTTITDVAALAGVSTATVSRVLNGIAVRPDLADAVRRSVSDLNYYPSRTARSLRRQSGEVIALILPDIENPFFTSLARGVEDVAHGLGYSVVLCNSDDDVDKESRYLQIAISENMAGVIICPAHEKTSLISLTEAKRAVVVVDRPVRDDVDQVLYDNDALARTAVVALIDRGFKRIACITGPVTTVTGRERAATWRAELNSHGMRASEEMLIYANFRVNGGRTAATRLLALPQPPDAVVATNNLVGVGVLQVLAEQKVNLLNFGVSVVGELPFATSSTADISVVPIRPRQLGVTAARMLIDRVTGAVSGRGRHIVIDWESGDQLDPAHEVTA